MVTQCLKWKNIERPPRGFHSNVMMKINLKMGGTCHTLISRGPGVLSAQQQPIFQQPPASLMWIFDRPCMLVGIDVSHPDPGSDRPSIAAVVGSVDRKCSQYVASISSQQGKNDVVQALQEGFKKLVTCFRAKNNGAAPEHFVVYRDGITDSQFQVVLDNELQAMKNGMAELGYTEDAYKIAIVICQKGHHTRIVYEQLSAAEDTYVNPCPGLVVDSFGRDQSITSNFYNEFYLNSHAAIQGTSKPCKYALIFDEIGFKLSELELLSYWTCYLYGRCNRSVSYATPAYYAHWAARRGKNLFTAGGSEKDLESISNTWSQGNAHTMFFI